jgi:hypothetical protein
MTNQNFKQFFHGLTDEELLKRVSNGLVDEAHAIACDELSARGLEHPAVAELLPTQDAPYLGDMVLLVANLSPTEAHILASCLAAAGIQAATGDTDTVRTHQLWSIALGGAKIRVPTSQLGDAKEVLKAFQAGEFSLSDDFDVGESSS